MAVRRTHEMTPEQWQRISDITADALERPPGQREAFVRQSAGGDEVVYREVMRQLELEEDVPAEFLAGPIAVLPKRSESRSNSGRIHDSRTFTVGELLAGRFRILRFLSEGGMGEVYEAFDEELAEAVALKAIRTGIANEEGVVDRFRREVQRARRVAHPNVCRVYDLFTHKLPDGQLIRFLTMELLAGETLAARLSSRGRLTPDEALPLLTQMAEALAAAHHAGIVHRDFKPSNVMLVPNEDGTTRVVVTDFGLARRFRASHQAQDQSVISGLEGTPPYMAPEQIDVQQATPRSDMYALGLVAYEMLTGRLPFEGPTPLAAMAERLHTPPIPPRQVVPGLPEVWNRAVLRCLERDPAKRFDDVTEFPRMLAPRGNAELLSRRRLWLGAGVAAGAALAAVYYQRFHEPSTVAVLPFLNRSPDAELTYFADGLTEGLIAAFTKVKELQVLAYDSVSRFRTEPRSLPEIGQKLGAENIVYGHLQREGLYLRVSVHSVRARDSREIWSETLERGADDQFLLQDELSALVTRECRRLLTGVSAPVVPPRPAPRPEAYELYLKGRHFWNKRGEENLEQALQFFQAAIQRDPRYAAAHAGIAQTYNSLAGSARYPVRDAMDRARHAAYVAADLDPSLPDAHLALGIVAQRYDWDWRSASRSFQQALQLAPGNAQASHWYGGFLSDMGQSREAISAGRHAVALDPLSLPVSAALMMFLFCARDFEQVERQAQRAIGLGRQIGERYPPAFSFLGNAYLHLKKPDRALEAYEESLSQGSRSAVARLHYAYACGVMRKRDKAQTLINAAQDLPANFPASPPESVSQTTSRAVVRPFYTAIAYAGCGYYPLALAWLRHAYEEHSTDLTLLKVHPHLDSLRKFPEFGDLLSRMRFW